LIQSSYSENKEILLNLENLVGGLYFVVLRNSDNQIVTVEKIIKN